MPDNMMLQNSYIVAELPQSLISPHGNILASDVHSVVRSKKRKRSEIAIAVDSEAINLYDVRSSKLITSYVVSPEARFTCPPCSIRFPQQGAEPAKRRTYCSVTTPRPKLQSFTESFSIRAGQSRNFNTSAIELTGSSSLVIHLDVIGDEDYNLSKCKVLAVYADGEVRCLSQDLKIQEWKATMSVQVDFAVVMNLEQAQQTFLKSREDILAMIGGDTDALKIHLLFSVTRSLDNSKNHSTLRIAQIRTSGFGQNPLRELVSLTLPEPPHLGLGKLNYSWHGRSGSLLQHNFNALSIYDLTGSVPQLKYHVDLGKEKIFSCLLLSPCLIAINTKTSISVIDVQYRSLQGEYRFDQTLGAENLHGASTRLLSYLAASGLIVALQGREVSAVQLSMGKDNESRKRKRDGVLINSIGRGVFSNSKDVKPKLQNTPKALGTYSYLADSSKDWNKHKSNLDNLFIKDNPEDFEHAMEVEIGMTARGQEVEGKNLPDLRKLRYLLNKIFSIDNDSRANLIIVWLPRDLSRWLIHQGLFSIDQIEISLKLYGTLPRTSSLSVGAFVQAITKWDPSLELLLCVLKSPVSLETCEIAQALRQLVILDFPRDIKLLTNGEAEGYNGDVSTDSVPSLTIIDKNSVAHALFESIVVRLNDHPISKITRALKSELSISELRSLVDLLRTELVKGRWLSPHIEEDIILEGEDTTSSDQLHSIARLFNCAIDSIGTGGWIIGASTTEDLTETADTIAYMKAEISAALEGIEEATYLKGILEKVLLHGKVSLSKNHDVFGTGARPIVQQQQQQPFPISGADDLGMNALPMGLDLAQSLSTKRVGAGGQLVERSRRDIGGIRSRMVGKYSFDRILV